MLRPTRVVLSNSALLVIILISLAVLIPSGSHAAPIALRSPASEHAVPLEVDRPGKGIFLVASHGMPDPRFWRSVIFLLAHGEDGTLGVIINQPTAMSLLEVLPDLKGTNGTKHQLFFGGPVAIDQVLFLILSATPLERTEHIVDDIYGSGDRVVLEQMLSLNKPATELRFYVGHAGWSPGQLDAEITEGSWHLFQADSATVFDNKPDSIWKKLMKHRRSSQIMVWNH